MSEESRRSPFYWLAVLACAVYLLLFAFSVYVSARYFGVRKETGWRSLVSDSRWIVSSVDPEGPAAGKLQPGDRILALDGDSRASVLGAYRLRDFAVGDTYSLDVERDGVRTRVFLQPQNAAGVPMGPVFLLYSLLFFASGVGLGLLRPEDPQVRFLAATMMMVGMSLPTDALADAGRHVVGWERPMYLFCLCFAGWAFPMTYHFFSRFPTWASPGPVWHAVQWLLYSGAVLVWTAWATVHLVIVVHPDWAIRWLATHPAPYQAATWVLQGPFYIYLQLCLALALLVTAYNYWRLNDPGSRRRIRWVVAGLVAGCVPWLTLVGSYGIAGWIDTTTYRVLYPFAFLFTLCVPVSIGAAVWHEQLFDIKVLVRRGLQYLLARNALRALLVLPFAVLALSIVLHPNRTLLQILTEGTGWLNVVWIAAIAVSLRYRKRLETWLDRRFFREAYEQEQVLLQLMGEVRQQNTIAEMARLLSARIESVLHPAALHVFYRAQERSAMIAGHSSSIAVAGYALSEQHALLRIMDGAESARHFPSDFDKSLPDSERSWLQELGVRLVVPIPNRLGRLLGLLLLGERMSDEPYSATDRRLLEGIAAQIGVVYENQYLQDRVRVDADVRRHVLARLEESSVSLLKECPACGLCYDAADARCTADGAELALTLPVERTLDAKYRLDRAIGRGGMGAVYEATDLRLQRRVAAKVMTGALFGDRDAMRRFEREARAAARLDHPRLTRVHDYGTIGNDGAYLIMELIAGRTWRAELERSGAIEPARAADWFRQLLEGVQVAHQAGIVHRDLKPENVMVVRSSSGDELKIMDFGLAKVHDSTSGVTEAVTVVGTAMGTLGYMAPEALVGGVVDARADIFAIGVMVVESLTGARPFGGRTPQETIAALLNSSYHLPGESDDVRALDAVLQRCLAKDPIARYPSAMDLAKDLLPLLARLDGLDAHQTGVPRGHSPMEDVTR